MIGEYYRKFMMSSLFLEVSTLWEMRFKLFAWSKKGKFSISGGIKKEVLVNKNKQR